MKKIELTNNTFTQAVQQFRYRLEAQGASKSQTYSKPNLIKEFLYYLEQNGKTKLNQIDQKTVADYFSYLQERPLETKEGTMTIATLKKHREAVLRFIEFVLSANGKEVAHGESGITIRLPKADKPRHMILMEEDIETLINSCDISTSLGIRDRAILSLLYGCGLRRDELRGLQVEDIDLSKGRVRIDISKTKYGRDVPITPTIQGYIEDYLFNVRNMMLDTYSEITSFLITERGTAMSNSNIAKVVERLSERADLGKPVTCHLLRHSIATHLHRILPIEEVAQFLGHKNLDSTMIYTHLKTHYYG